MYKWQIIRQREPQRCVVRWEDGSELVERSAALPIDNFRRTIPLVPHTAIPRRKGDVQHFDYPNNLMHHPLLTPVGRTVFNYTGGLYSLLIQSTNQAENYYIRTAALATLQEACNSILGYMPNAVLFTLEMPFGLYGLPTPLSSDFERSLLSIYIDIANKLEAIKQDANSSLYNIINERSLRILKEFDSIKQIPYLFSFYNTPSID